MTTEQQDTRRWVRELNEAGWREVRRTVWEDPLGALWRGPYGAWKQMLVQTGQSALLSAAEPATSSPAAPEPAKEEIRRATPTEAATVADQRVTDQAGAPLRVFGPSDNPDWPDCYLGDVGGDLSGLIENLKEYLPQMHPEERYVLRVQAMTDAEVEGLPDL